MKARPYRFEVVFEKEEEGGYHAYCPDLPGCHTWGRNLSHARKMIREAVLAYCESLRKHGEPIPHSRGRTPKVITGRINIGLKAA